MINVIKQSVKSVDICDVMKRVEYAGRTCYNSLDKMTDSTSEPFVRGLLQRGHGTPLEAARIVIDLNTLKDAMSYDKDYRDYYQELIPQIRANKYPRVYIKDECLSINLRDYVFMQLPFSLLLDPTMYSIDPDFATVIFVTDRGVANECVRHRVLSYDDNGYPTGFHSLEGNLDDMSMVQASTRYISYGKYPFAVVESYPAPWSRDTTSKDYQIWEKSCEASIEAYKELLACGNQAQFARDVLPLSTATTVVMSGTSDQWNGFLKLRLATDAHPKMIVLADMILHSDAVRECLGEVLYQQLCEYETPGLEKVLKIYNGGLK